MIRALHSSLAASLLSALICHYPVPRFADSVSPGDPRVAYLRAHAVKIRSISPDERDFSDLEPLRAAIGTRRIVMLGEESHGDGATFLAKTRLIEFLHERMGFNVLAFESGFYDVHRAWEDLAAGMEPMAAIRSGIFGLWTDVAQTQPLWRYAIAASHSRDPLVLAGIDSQFTGTASKEHFLNDLATVLDDLPQDASLLAARTRVTTVLTSYFGHAKGPDGLAAFQKLTTTAEQARFYIAIAKLRESLEDQTYRDPATAARRDYWVRVLASASLQFQHLWHTDFKHLQDKPGPAFDWASFNLRDEAMGENLVWLARNEFANEKIIVWAATSHEMRHRRFFTNEYTPYVPMGEWVDRVMAADVYTIGFTAFEGKEGIGDASNIGVAGPGSLEQLFYDTGAPYAFLDFRHLGSDGAWLTDPLPAWPLGYQAETTSWPATMDGMFSIQTMTPSTPLPGML